MIEIDLKLHRARPASHRATHGQSSYLVVRKYEERSTARCLGHTRHKFRIDDAKHRNIIVFRDSNRVKTLVLLERLPVDIPKLAISHKFSHFVWIYVR